MPLAAMFFGLFIPGGAAKSNCDQTLYLILSVSLAKQKMSHILKNERDQKRTDEQSNGR